MVFSPRIRLPLTTAACRCNAQIPHEIERVSPFHCSRLLHSFPHKMTISKQCCEVRPAEFLIIGGRPCKVLEVEKLPSNQILIVGRDFFNGGVVEERRPPEYIVEEPKITKSEFSITEYDEEDNVIMVQCEKTGISKKIAIPEGFIGDDLRIAVEDHDGPIRVTIASTCGEEGIVAFQKC